MTENEWQVCSDPLLMLDFLRDKTSDRKLRLLLAACCRRIWPVLAQESQEDVIWIERLADDPTCPEAIEALQRDIEVPVYKELVSFVRFMVASPEGMPAEKLAYVELLRDIFGNPFRSVAVNPYWLSWNESTTLNLAKTIYDERLFHQLPILADALEDAGCQNSDLLQHCRSEGPHVRGCWVIDMMLARS